MSNPLHGWGGCGFDDHWRPRARAAAQADHAAPERDPRFTARVVVTDITGVGMIDLTVANHLVQAVEAARLMGAVRSRPERIATRRYHEAPAMSPKRIDRLLGLSIAR